MRLALWCILMLVVSCNGDYLPKPKAYLRLQYPKATYENKQFAEVPLTFDVSDQVGRITIKSIPSSTKSYGINLNYDSLKATLFLTYKAVKHNAENLNAFLNDAQKLTLEHTKKADEIPVYPFVDSTRKVYGILSEVKGNAASPAQFYVTDSVSHFLTGSLYFEAKPNYDSILPAAKYLQNDIKVLMETLSWK